MSQFYTFGRKVRFKHRVCIIGAYVHPVASRVRETAIGRIVRQTLEKTAAAVKPGITTGELDEIGARVLAENGAESAPPKIYGFPAAVCISVNEESMHGIPGARAIRSGDLVKLDLVAEKDGFYADAAVTVRAGRKSV